MRKTGKKEMKAPTRKLKATAEKKKAPQSKDSKKILKAVPTVKRSTAKKAKPPAPPQQAPDACNQILAELKTLRASINKTSQPVSPDAALETGVDSIRRLLSELLEQRTESILGELAAIRHSICDSDPETSARIDKLLARLGAIKFTAEPMDYVDPLIHSIAAEHKKPDLPEGVIISTIRPGYRTGRGIILEKALVAVNRRS